MLNRVLSLFQMSLALTRGSILRGQRPCYSSFVFLPHHLLKYYIHKTLNILFEKYILNGKDSDKPSLSPCIPFLSPFASFREEKTFLPYAINSCILPEMSTTSKSIAISPQRSARWNTLTINMLYVLPSSTAKLFKDDACHKTQQALSICWMNECIGLWRWKVG